MRKFHNILSGTLALTVGLLLVSCSGRGGAAGTTAALSAEAESAGGNGAQQNGSQSSASEPGGTQSGSIGQSGTKSGAQGESSPQGSGQSEEVRPGTNLEVPENGIYTVPADPQVIPGELLQTDYFTLVIPEDLEDLCDVTVTPDSILLYEKYAHQNGAGFVTAFTVYKDVSDYANNPHYERGGVFTDLGKQTCDLVIEYPSDVQLDPAHPEEYGTLTAAVPAILKTLRPVRNYTYTLQEYVDTSGIYAGLLEEFSRVLSEGATPEQLAAGQAFSPRFGMNDTDTQTGPDTGDLSAREEPGVDSPSGRASAPAGGPYESAAASGNTPAYCFMDITGDGYDELLLGVSDGAKGNEVYDLYAPVNGKPVHIFSATENRRYFLLDRPQTLLLYEGYAEGTPEKDAPCTQTICVLPSQTASMDVQLTFRWQAAQGDPAAGTPANPRLEAQEDRSSRNSQNTGNTVDAVDARPTQEAQSGEEIQEMPETRETAPPTCIVDYGGGDRTLMSAEDANELLARFGAPGDISWISAAGSV